MKKGLIIALIVIIFTIAASVAIINIFIDPLGVFGVPSLDWYSYENIDDFILAKLLYLDKNHNKYDSYLIGSSAAACYDIEAMNNYFNASFYNLYTTNSNAVEYYALATIAIEHFNAKNIVVNIDTFEPAAYNKSQNTLSLHADALYSKTLPIKFFLQYVFQNPKYALAKSSTSQLSADISLFTNIIPETGEIDYSEYNEKKIGDMETYNKENAQSFRIVEKSANLPSIISSVDCIERIKELCARKGVNLIVIASPVYSEQWKLYDRDQLSSFKTKLANAVNYWDFSNTSLSYDSRYFYSKHHFRKDVTRMMLAEIFNDTSVYRADDFGTYITKDNINTELNILLEDKIALKDLDLPILMYHHFDNDVSNYMVVSPKTFEQHLKTISDAGYNTIDFKQLVDYVYKGTPLPENPVILTFDDGYTSNYEIARPILEKYGMKATVFAIGSSFGKSTYKDTSHSITPHFSLDLAGKMLEENTIQIESHSFDMHQWAAYEENTPARSNIIPFEGESDEDFTFALLTDIYSYSELWWKHFKRSFYALSYPGGQYNQLSEKIIHNAGIPVTVTSDTDTRNIIVQGLPQTLYALSRWNITEKTTSDSILSILQNNKNK